MSNPKTYIVVWNDLNETSFLINLLFDEWVNKSWNHPIEVSQPPKHTWLDEMDLINKSTAAFLPFLCQSRPQLFCNYRMTRESLSRFGERRAPPLIANLYPKLSRVRSFMKTSSVLWSRSVVLWAKVFSRGENGVKLFINLGINLSPTG